MHFLELKNTEDDVAWIYLFSPAPNSFFCYSDDGQQSQGREKTNFDLCTINITPDKQNALEKSLEDLHPYSACHTVVLSI